MPIAKTSPNAKINKRAQSRIKSELRIEQCRKNKEIGYERRQRSHNEKRFQRNRKQKLEFYTKETILNILLDLHEGQEDPVYSKDDVIDSIDFEFYPG